MSRIKKIEETPVAPVKKSAFLNQKNFPRRRRSATYLMRIYARLQKRLKRGSVMILVVECIKSV
jgi:hypothetical protein